MGIPSTPANWLARFWADEKAKMETNPDYKPTLPAIVYSERITEQQYSDLMLSFPLQKPRIDIVRHDVNGAGN